MDTSPLIAVQCGRRSGKSYGAAKRLYKDALSMPYVNVLYLALTRQAAKNIMYEPYLKGIARELSIPIDSNDTELTVRLPNNSKIICLGVDAKPADMDKVLGQKFLTVVIDEAAFFRQDLFKLVYEILKPAVADYNGTIILISTPSSLTSSLFYDIMHGEVKGWKTYKWSALDNPFMKQKIMKEMKDLKDANPLVESTPFYQRMYLNEWFVDDDNLVYKFNPKLNVVDSLPEDYEWNYVLGLDLGYEDDTAWTVLAYSEHHKNLFVVETLKKAKLIISDVAEITQKLDEKYSFVKMVVDGAGKQAVEEMRQRYNLPLESAEKRDKRSFIEILNADLMTGKIKVISSTCKELTKEWENLIWDERAKDEGRYIEHSACPNHLSDSFLYGWRWCYNYAWTPKAKPKIPHSEERVDEFWEREAEKLEANKYSTIPQWEREYNNEGW